MNIIERCYNLGLGYNFDSIRGKYDESHRYYHNWDHIKFMMTKADEISKMSIKPTIIRGLRNSTDFENEKIQLEWINELSDIETIFIKCNREFEHISSSAIKNLRKFGYEY